MVQKLDWTLIASKSHIEHLYHKQRMSLKETATILGVCTTCLRLRMIKLGIPRRPHSWRKCDQGSLHKQVMSVPGWEKMAWKDLANKLNCSVSVVNRAKTAYNKQKRREETENVQSKAS